jgi:hypothetical protein
MGRCKSANSSFSNTHSSPFSNPQVLSVTVVKSGGDKN